MWGSVVIFWRQKGSRAFGKHWCRSFSLVWLHQLHAVEPFRVVISRGFHVTHTDRRVNNGPLLFALHQLVCTVGDFRLPPQCKWDLLSFGILRSVQWYLRADVSKQPIGPFLRGPAVKGILLTLEDGTDMSIGRRSLFYFTGYIRSIWTVTPYAPAGTQ